MTKAVVDRAAERLHAVVDELAHRAPGLDDRAVAAFQQVADVISAGGQVAIFDAAELLTTGQAAALLGLSRMTVVRLIERGELAADTASSHRRIAASELARYQADSRRIRHEALPELAVDIDGASADAVISTR